MPEQPGREPEHGSELPEWSTNDYMSGQPSSDEQMLGVVADYQRGAADFEERRRELDEEVRKLEEADRIANSAIDHAERNISQHASGSE